MLIQCASIINFNLQINQKLKSIDQSQMSQPSPTKSPITSSQQLQPQPSKDSQTITLPVSQLLKWQKKSKQLTLQIKNLTAQNQSLKDELAQLKKKPEQKRKNDNFVQGLQQTIKQLQKILDQNMVTLTKTKKENIKLQDEHNLTKELFRSKEQELIELREVSSHYFLLKQQINKLQNQISNMKVNESDIVKVKQELENSKLKIYENQNVMGELKEKIQNLNILIKEHEVKNSELQKNLNATKEELHVEKKQKQEFDNKIKEYEMRIDDLEKQNQLTMIKQRQQIKDLKQLLLNQQFLKQKYQSQAKQTKNQQQTSASQIPSRNEHLENKDTEYLLVKIQQLQTQNAVAKYMMNETSSKIDLVEQKLKTRTEALIALTKEYAGRWPNLDQSDGLEYIDHQILKEAGVNKTGMDVADLVERCVIQNLRLKYMVGMIGSEYNNQLRKKEGS